MALDTKYRPLTYKDVLGQDATKQLLKSIVASGAGRHQSYLFSGNHGSGKTTLGRILARALLCEAPVEGEPCDQCQSCQSLLQTGSSLSFTEVDAATNSGVDKLRAVIEELEYSSYDGTKKLYLFDESHRLSLAALDVLLKPMEDTERGSEDKRLVVIFCTTEPEKMRPTVISRSLQFKIRPVAPEVIAERLAWVCQQEGFKYEQEALVLIAQLTETHIRDALKVLEGVALQGDVTDAAVRSYLGLEANTHLTDLLSALGRDLDEALNISHKLLGMMAPATLYSRLADLTMIAYRHRDLKKLPPQWAEQDISRVLERHGEGVLGLCDVFSSRPKKASASSLFCDVAKLHYAVCAGGVAPGDFDSRKVVVGSTLTGAAPAVSPKLDLETLAKLPVPTGTVAKGDKDGWEQHGDVHVFTKARATYGRQPTAAPDTDPASVGAGMTTQLFSRLLAIRVSELGADEGPPGHTTMGSD